jgi:adenylate kinase
MTSQREIYLFIGAPGSGKGSLAQKCAQELGWRKFSTGDECRKHVNEQTEIGKEIDFAIKSGKLITDELVIAMAAEWLNQNNQDVSAVILDGYPRTIIQAQALDKLLQLGAWKLYVIKLVVGDETVVARLSNRYICQNKRCQAIYSLDTSRPLSSKNEMTCKICGAPLERRKDDEPETVRERLSIYHKHEDELLQFYCSRGQIIKELKVERPLPDVFRDFQQLIGFNGA